MSDKPYDDMDEVELREELAKWGNRVETAPCFASAYASAKECKAIVAVAKRKGFDLENKWPIKKD